MQQFARRLFGYSVVAVAEAFAGLDTEHSAELARLRREIALAHEATLDMNRRLSDLEGRFKEAEARVQGEILTTLQVQGREHQILQEAARRHDAQRDQLLEQIAERETVLGTVQRMNGQFAQELDRVLQRYREALSDMGRVTLAVPELSVKPAPAVEVRRTTDGV